MGLGHEIKKSGRRRSSVMKNRKSLFIGIADSFHAFMRCSTAEKSGNLCDIIIYPGKSETGLFQIGKRKIRAFFHDDILSHLRIVNVNKLFAHRL